MLNTVHLLSVTDRCALHHHFALLSDEDLLMRFGRARDPEWLALVVNGLDFTRNTVLGIRESMQLTAVAHLALFDDAAELGLSVIPSHRRRGMGTALFQRALHRARDHGVNTLYIRELARNPVLRHIAHQSGTIWHEKRLSGDVWLELPPVRSAPYIKRPTTTPRVPIGAFPTLSASRR